MCDVLGRVFGARCLWCLVWQSVELSPTRKYNTVFGEAMMYWRDEGRNKNTQGNVQSKTQLTPESAEAELCKGLNENVPLAPNAEYQHWRAKVLSGGSGHHHHRQNSKHPHEKPQFYAPESSTTNVIARRGNLPVTRVVTCHETGNS